MTDDSVHKQSMVSPIGDYQLIERCRGCSDDMANPIPVLAMDPMPLAGNFCVSEKAARNAPRYPLTWLQCPHCGLLQVAEDIAQRSLFERYHYASSSVPPLVQHFRDYAAKLTNRYGASSTIRLLEIGCNDGVLLNQLPKSWTLMGVDPCDVASRHAVNSTAYQLTPAPFTPELVESLNWTESWDIITGSNCLAHISDLKAVFFGVAMALKPDGWFWVEVHDLNALLRGAQWDTIYHEHKVEWNIDSLTHCLHKLGFELREQQHLPLHGGLLRCGFRKSGDRRYIPETPSRNRRALNTLRQAYMNRNRSATAIELKQAQSEGLRIAAYGASGRAVVYLNQLLDLSFSFIVDESPLRKDHFIPGVGTPIVDRDELFANLPAKILITAWNYREHIINRNRKFPGNWLTAFPAA